MVKKVLKVNNSIHGINFSPKFKNKDEDSDAGSQADYTKTGDTTLQAAAKWTFFEYFKESSIHGFKYIGNRHRHSIPDRIIWILALVISIITCYFYISDIWYQRLNNPAIVSFNEKQTPVWKIPFPTVTICPETKTASEVFNYTKAFWKNEENKNLTEKEQFYWEALSQICKNEYWQLNTAKDFANTTDLIAAMTEMLQRNTSIDTMYDCIWRNNFENCSDEFPRFITEDGICYSFNSLKSIHYRDELKDTKLQEDSFYVDADKTTIKWNVENGYNKTEDMNSFPKRALGSSPEDGLRLLLASWKQDKDLMCREAVTGYKVILSTPGEEPQVYKNFVNVPLGKSVQITIKPAILTAFNGLQDYEAHKRECFFQDERPLRYFKVYNQPNCELECLANATLERCGCVKFSMPRNPSHRVCGANKTDCVFDTKSYVNEINFNISNRHRLEDSAEARTLCDCLPLCTSIKYNSDFGSQFDFDYLGLMRAYKFAKVLVDNPGLEFTEIKIHFNKDRFNGLKRSEFCSNSDFIANCGGLLGLFMGVSILSLVEVVYFFTVKLWTNLKMRKFKNRQHKKFKAEP